MKFQENAVLDALQRAGPFLDENAEALSGADFTAARKRLTEVVTSFSTHALNQDVGTRGSIGETAKQRQLRFNLRTQQMEPIAVIARHNLQSVPEFKALQMPRQSVRGQAFIASARGMADAATVHKDTLVAHGLPATHLDDLRAGIVKLEASISDRDKGRAQRAGATKGLAVEEKNGQTVLSVLDSLVKQALDGENESLLRKWQSVRRVRRRAVNSTSTPAPATQPTPATTSQPAPATQPTPATTSQPTPATGAPTPTAVSTSTSTVPPVNESSPAAAA